MNAHLPLEGLKVLELGVWVLAPTTACVLGEWGADVVKIEDTKGGDPLRGLLLTGVRPDHAYNYTWQLLNRNKRGIALDLKTEQGLQVLQSLLKTADVFVTNLRAPAIRRLGLDYESVSALNPRLIYAQATGFGLKGPDADRAGFDETAYWMRGGIMSVLGDPEGPPVPLRGAMGDLPTGIFLAGGICAALIARERFGMGQRVDTSLLASGIWVNAMDVQTTLTTGVQPGKRDRRRVPNPLYTTYRTEDGRWLQFQMLQTERFWPAVCKAIARPDLEADRRFDSHEKRLQNSEAAIGLLGDAIARRPLVEWKARFDECGLIWEAETTIAEVVADPQMAHNNYLPEMPHPTFGPIKVVGTPIQFGRTPVRPRLHAPELGEHTEEVLLEAGYEWGDMARLREAGAIL